MSKSEFDAMEYRQATTPGTLERKRDLLDPWVVFQAELGYWSDATFGSKRPPETSFSHLEEEVQELKAAPRDLMEYADCFILLIDAARRAGYDMMEVLEACKRKLEINRKRKWGKPDATGKVNHVPGT